jgi:uncharacterized membrane protein
MEIIITVLSIFLIITFYVIWNLLKKLEKMEDYINNLSLTMNYISKRLKEIDNLGMFESDDEIGWFFEEIKKLGDQLDQYKLG